jgi:hypothetical protein
MSGKQMRKAALRRYAVYRIKIIEFVDLNVLRDGLIKGQIRYAENLRPPKFMAQSIRTAVLSYFALFVDKNGMNVIELWKELFPKHRKLVEDTWARIQPTWDTIREFRDRAGFHADKPMKFFGARYSVAQDHRIEKALGEFVGLIRFFLRAEYSGELSDFETELDSLLDDLEVAQPKTYQREQFKAYLMLKKI